MATPKKSPKTTKKAAAKSGSPKKRAASGRTTPKQVTSASAWKGKDTKLPHELELPSGNVCLVQRVGMESFLTGGIIPNSLLPIITEQLEKAKARAGTRKKAMKKEEETEMMKLLVEEPEKVQDMLRLFDIITCGVVIEPYVRMGEWTEEDLRGGLCTEEQVGQKIPYGDRDNNILYADLVDDADKQFIFNYVVGGSADIERFRSEAAQRVASVAK